MTQPTWDWEDPASLEPVMDAFTRNLATCAKLEPLAITAPYARSSLTAFGITGIEFAAWRCKHPQGLGSDIVPLRAGEETTSPGSVYRVDGTHHFVQLDIAEPLPFSDGAVDWVYAEHLIEHVPLPVAVGWLTEVRRILTPGGLLRLTTPDLARYVSGYLDSDDAFFSRHRHRLKRAGVGPAMPARRAFMFNQIFYLYGHQWIYDEAELRHVVEAAGFDPSAMRVCAYREGSVAEVAGLDQMIRNDETIYVEVTA